MSISSECPHCGARYEVDAQFAGRNVKCGKCSAVIVIGSAQSPTALAVPAAVAHRPAQQKKGIGNAGIAAAAGVGTVAILVGLFLVFRPASTPPAPATAAETSESASSPPVAAKPQETPASVEAEAVIAQQTPKPFIERVTVADRDGPAIVQRWNDAVAAEQGGDWKGASEILRPADRRGLASTGPGRDVLRMCLPGPISAEKCRVVVYKTRDGAGLARIYGERRDELTNGREKVPIVSRIVFGTMTRQRDEPWFLDSCGRDDHPFGIGASVEGIRFTVRPVEQMIKSWEDLAVTMTLENTGDHGIVPVRSRPSFCLERNLVLGLIKAQSLDRESRFKRWYEKVEAMSPASVSGMLEAARRQHEIIGLKPGQTQTHELNLRSLCWWGGTFAQGPTGTFELFLVYDAGMEWDQAEAALPAWTHRIASNVFRVTVRGAGVTAGSTSSGEQEKR